VGAFEKPVRASSDIALTDASVAVLGSHWGTMERAYGQPGEVYYLNLSAAPFERGTSAGAADELVDLTVSAVRRILSV
jgi:hypothetical protein